MAQALYSAFTIHRAVGGAGATSPEQVMNWATQRGAQALGFDGVGTLEVGKAADVVVIDLGRPRYFGHHDPTIALIISGGEFHIRHSFVGGREIVVDGQVPWLDLQKLRADSARIVAAMKAAAAG